jgi:hypothetical protein
MGVGRVTEGPTRGKFVNGVTGKNWVDGVEGRKRVSGSSPSTPVSGSGGGGPKLETDDDEGSVDMINGEKLKELKGERKRKKESDQTVRIHVLFRLNLGERN